MEDSKEKNNFDEVEEILQARNELCFRAYTLLRKMPGATNYLNKWIDFLSFHPTDNPVSDIQKVRTNCQRLQ